MAGLVFHGEGEASREEMGVDFVAELAGQGQEGGGRGLGLGRGGGG